MSAKMLWAAGTTNRKTGNVPTAWIGDSKEQAWNSCEGCELRDTKRCYAWYGTVRVAFHNILKGYLRNPSKYSFENAMKERSNNARMVRVGAIGDPAEADHAELIRAAKYVRRRNMAFIGYTHHHARPENTKLATYLMASCETMEQADSAIARGWRATVVVPYNFSTKRFKTPEGNEGVVCPAQTKPGEITCNDCRLCDADSRSNFKVIAFKDHGPQVRNKIRGKRLALA